MKTIELGNIGSLEQVRNLILLLSGKTYMNFIVDYAVAAGNYPVSVSTEHPTVTQEELKDMVLFYLACNI